MTAAWTVLALAVGLAATGVNGAGQTGRSTVSGVVVDDQSSQPVRYAAVMLGTPDSSLVASIHTDDAGRFRFDRVAAGRYVLSLDASRYVRTQHGASKPGGRGRLIDVADGAHVEGIVARMTPGAILSGILRHPNGDPVHNAAVRLWRWSVSPATGEAKAVFSDPGNSTTDDRGHFRIYQLPAGEYLVASDGEQIQHHGAPLRGQEPTPLLTHAAIEAMKRGELPEASQAPAQGKVTTFFPGVVRPADAERIVVAAGQERAGLDFVLQTMPVASIRGTVTLPADAASMITLVSIAPLGADAYLLHGVEPTVNHSTGAFVASGVRPGEYRITAATYPRSGTTASSDPTRPVNRFFGTTSVTVQGRDVTDVVVPLKPGGTIGGTVRFIGDPPGPADLARMRLMLAWAGSGPQGAGPPEWPSIGADGRFEVKDVPPGSYSLLATPAGGWLVQSVVSKSLSPGAVLEVDGQHIGDLIVTLGRAASLSGTVTTAAGTPAGDGWLVVFSTDRAMRRMSSARIAAMQIRADGSFSFNTLAGGDYFITALPDLDMDQIYSAALLEHLEAAALRITLTPGERRVQPVVLRR